jgi:hypothetical protein
MPALARTRSYQYLDIHTGTPGALADAVSVEFTIFDISTEAKRATPVQVYPVAPTVRVALDLVTDKLATGHYRTTWAPVDVGTFLHSRGRHRITWHWKLTALGTEYETSEEFDVVSAARSWGYALPSDLRDEGLTTTQATDQRLANVIQLSTQMIERYCGRWFEPRTQTFTLDADNQRVLNLPQPIVALTSVLIDTTAVEIADIEVYNRHLTESLTTPDDREIPKLEWSLEDLSYGGAWLFSPGVWTKGQKIVQVAGVFGYTDPDGSVVGVIPPMIQHACKLLVMREFPTMALDADTREDRQQRWRVVGDRTRDQAITMSPLAAGSITGDVTVDRILDSYRRLPRVTAV